MKVIITGATGRVGSGVLQQCLAHPAITSIIALTRREPAISHPSLEWIQHTDFTVFPPEVLSKLRGAVACLYCLGTNVTSEPASLLRVMNLEYTLATASFLAENLAGPDSSASPFRFVYVSGAFVEKNQARALYFMADTRRMRGQLETQLLELDQHTDDAKFKVFIVRPGIVQVENAGLGYAVFTMLSMLGPAIKQHVLGKAIVRIALSGNQQTILENKTLLQIGKE